MINAEYSSIISEGSAEKSDSAKGEFWAWSERTRKNESDENENSGRKCVVVDLKVTGHW